MVLTHAPQLPEGARVNVYLPHKVYVAVGTALRSAVPIDEAVVLHEGRWQRLLDLDLLGSLPAQRRRR